MEENMVSTDEISSSIAYLNKKRKTETELQEMPLSKHFCCWSQILDHDSSSDLSTDQNAKDSCSPDSVMPPYISSYPETVEACTSSDKRNGNSSESGLYSLQSRSVTKARSSKSSISEELDRLHRDYGLHIYEDHLLEFETHDDSSCPSEYKTEKDLDEMLYSNEVAPSNYIRSSGRLSVNQDAQQGTRKQTIDKEFEEYFSMLMM